MKKHGSTIILILIFLVGLSLILYPTISDYWHYFHQYRAKSDYAERVTHMDDNTFQDMMDAAQDYNQRLFWQGSVFAALNAEEKAEYQALLDINENGMMGYIDIPAIKCSLPIYHGTDETVLRTAVGHVEWSSLPVGGESTHCVLSGHRGLPSTRLFTDIDKLAEGDRFFLNILGEVLTYEVDQILTVLPDELESLRIEEGEDYCTLVTCTPYGINTHRLLVRGHRVDTLQEDQVRVTEGAMRIDTFLIATVAAVPMLLVLLLLLLLEDGRKRKKKRFNKTKGDKS